MRNIIFWFIQCTWGMAQSLAGFVIFLLHIKDKHFLYKGAVVTVWDRKVGLSLGMFIFVWPEDTKVLVHEYGHSIQSMILGPLYLLLVGIPSALWANTKVFKARRRAKKISYYAFYPERWASSLGERVTGEKTYR